MILRHGGRGYTKSHGKQRHNKSKTLPRATLILDRARFKPTNHLTRQDSFLSLKAETDHHSAAIIRCTRTSALQARHPKPRLSLSQRGAALESCCVFVCCKSHAWSLCWKRTCCWWKKICTKWVKVTVMSLGEFYFHITCYQVAMIHSEMCLKTQVGCTEIPEKLFHTKKNSAASTCGLGWMVQANDSLKYQLTKKCFSSSSLKNCVLASFRTSGLCFHIIGSQ